MARPPAASPASSLPPARDPAGPYRVCMVCMANICRSPMAEVVLRAHLAAAGLAGRVMVDSGGTVGWRAGEQMDSGARAALARRGYDGEAHCSRQFSPDWLPGRDLVLTMDTSNLKALESLFRTNPPDSHRLHLFGDIAQLQGADIPDPYGGSPDDFDRVLTMLETGMPALVAQLSVVAPRSTLRSWLSRPSRRKAHPRKTARRGTAGS